MGNAITNAVIHHPSVEELAAISVFADLPTDGLAWLAAQMEMFELQPGDILVRAGETAEHLAVLFQGEVRAVREDGRVYVMHAGQVTGLLPYSRLTRYPSNAHAVQ
jgi:CRP-like cAMP-binding protein